MGVAVKKAQEFTSLTPPAPKKEKRGSGISEPTFTPSPPSLYIDVEVPGLSNMQVGQEFTATTKCRLESSEVREGEQGVKRRSYTVRVTEISVGD